jgi:imidazolonepropionase
MNDKEQYLIGPFSQVVSLRSLPLAGPLDNEQLEIIEEGGVLVSQGKITKVGSYNELSQQAQGYTKQEISGPHVLMPGFIDAHTHICFGGSRANDYALRTSGKSYLDIARSGGGILDSVRKTRAASPEELLQGLLMRCRRHLNEGITTCEVKSGYGLSVDDELKMLRTIAQANAQQPMDLVATCLAAHTMPPEFTDKQQYLSYIVKELLPAIKQEGLSRRVDIFVEDTAFEVAIAEPFLQQANAAGFDITIHADQFTTGGSALACRVGALSADHLEASTGAEVEQLAQAGVAAVVLPGASLGLGMQFAPARMLLNQGVSVVIATDWNPGSAPMGDLLLQAAVLGAMQKLSHAEVFAGITYRAASALGLPDRGTLAEGMLADMVAFPCADYREILYQQGKLKPVQVWKKGLPCIAPSNEPDYV